MKTEQEKKVSCEDFSHFMSGNRHIKSRLYPLADTLTETVFSLKGNDGKEFTHKKSPSTILAHEDAISSHLNFKSEGLRSLAELIISDSYYSSPQHEI